MWWRDTSLHGVSIHSDADLEELHIELAIAYWLVDQLMRCHNHTFLVVMETTPPTLLVDAAGAKCAKDHLRRG